MIAKLQLLPIAPTTDAIPPTDKELYSAMEILLKQFRKVVDIKENMSPVKYFVDRPGFTREGLINWVRAHCPQNHCPRFSN